eukprot:3528272-Prymnesium_polylepis.1
MLSLRHAARLRAAGDTIREPLRAGAGKNAHNICGQVEPHDLKIAPIRHVEVCPLGIYRYSVEPVLPGRSRERESAPAIQHGRDGGHGR